jgi:hypothetical protein
MATAAGQMSGRARQSHAYGEPTRNSSGRITSITTPAARPIRVSIAASSAR